MDTRALAAAVNAYRSGLGLTPVPVSPSLTTVAEAHIRDLERHYVGSDVCNLHSWSTGGSWTACCYDGDEDGPCMWGKPSEITRGTYTAPGYEIAVRDARLDAAGALELWRTSPAHHAVIVNGGDWANLEWRAIGAAHSDHFAVVWFGEAEDPM